MTKPELHSRLLVIRHKPKIQGKETHKDKAALTVVKITIEDKAVMEEGIPQDNHKMITINRTILMTVTMPRHTIWTNPKLPSMTL